MKEAYELHRMANILEERINLLEKMIEPFARLAEARVSLTDDDTVPVSMHAIRNAAKAFYEDVDAEFPDLVR